MIPRITLVTPVYNEAAGLRHYVDEVRTTLLNRDDMAVRVLFVDDGSTDNSWKEIQTVAAEDDRFRGVRLSRNFGSHAAIAAGFDHLDDSTDAAAVLAADLQDPPDVIIEFVERWRKGADIVWGRRNTRRDERWRVVASRAFHALLRRFAMPKGSLFTTGSFVLLDRRVVEAVRHFKESNRITFALVAWTGFEQDVVDYDRRPRITGRSGWSFSDMLRAMYDAFIGFSGLPIKLMEGAALASFLIAVSLAIYLVAAWMSGRTRVPGWTSQMLLFSGFFGVQFWLVGMLGQYLARIHREVVGRPLYFVSHDTLAPPSSSDRRPNGEPREESG